jgi:hypothetical protein
MPSGPRHGQGTGLLPELESTRGTAAERDSLLDAAMRAGKFSEKRRAHYAAMYDKDPKSTRRLIDSLAGVPQSQPASERGTGLFPELG